MSLLTAWKESLYLLRPQSGKLLLLVSLNAFIKGWAVLWRAVLWWLVPVSIILYYCVNMFELSAVAVNYAWYPLDMLTRWSGLYGISAYYMRYLFVIYTGIFTWCLAIHPSVERKDMYYFCSLKHVPRFIIGWFIFVFYNLLFWRAAGALVVWLKFAPVWHSYARVLSDIIGLLIVFTVLSMSYVLPLLTLFFLFDTRLDSTGLISILINPIRMAMYNIPVALFTTVGFIAILMGFGIMFGSVLSTIVKVRPSNFYASLVLFGFVGVFVLVFVCIINTLYIKKLYDNKNLYI